MRRLLKLDQWWSLKIPPLVAIAVISAARGSALPPLDRFALHLALFLVSCLGIGGFGYVFTDAWDVEEDLRRGRPNTWARLPPIGRATLVVALLIAALAPWIWLLGGVLPRALLAFEFLLFFVYAVPPLRFKERGLAGVLVDGMYAHAIPAAVAVTLFSQETSRPWTGLACVLAWSAPMGWRNILTHQVDDLEADRRSGARTYAASHGRAAALRIITHYLLPAELLGFVAFAIWAWPAAPLLLVGALGLGAWELTKRRYFWMQPLPPVRTWRPIEWSDTLGIRVLNRYAATLLAVVAVLGAAAQSPAWLLLLPVVLLLFRRAWRPLIAEDRDIWVRVRQSA